MTCELLQLALPGNSSVTLGTYTIPLEPTKILPPREPTCATLYFIDSQRCPFLEDALKEHHVRAFLDHLEAVQHVGPPGRSSKLQIIMQAIKYKKGHCTTDSTLYFE